MGWCVVRGFVAPRLLSFVAPRPLFLYILSFSPPLSLPPLQLLLPLDALRFFLSFPLSLYLPPFLSLSLLFLLPLAVLSLSLLYTAPRPALGRIGFSLEPDHTYNYISEKLIVWAETVSVGMGKCLQGKIHSATHALRYPPAVFFGVGFVDLIPPLSALLATS